MGAKQDKNLFIPNIPSNEYKLFLKNQRNKYQLITLGIIDKQLDYYNIFDAVCELKKKYPSIILKIIGNGPKENEYKKYVIKNNLQKNVKFLGYLDHHRALEEISKSGIGLALYNGKWGFNYYGDSMKCREYFSFGLPVITTNTHSTVEEVKEFKAGIVCKMDKEDYKKAITEILKNYKNYSSCSYELAKKYNNVHAKLISQLLTERL
jgi:glycosyltransferase involved in cell wall biosynthesis